MTSGRLADSMLVANGETDGIEMSTSIKIKLGVLDFLIRRISTHFVLWRTEIDSPDCPVVFGSKGKLQSSCNLEAKRETICFC